MSLKDYAICLNDTKLFGYIDHNTERLLMGISYATVMTGPTDSPTDEKKVYPIMYFEEEGWIRLHYLEFNPTVDHIIWGCRTFDFDQMDWSDQQTAKRKYYMMCLIRDRATNWTVTKMTGVGQHMDPRVEQYMVGLMLMGKRPEDLI